MQLEYLNGLRGLCALSVVWFHFLYLWLPAALDGAMYRAHLGGAWEAVMARMPFYVAGNSPVCIFFVLSGYVLSLRFWRERSQACLISAALRRYIRLTGPVLGSVLLAWLLMKAGLLEFDALMAASGAGWKYYQMQPDLLMTLKEAFWDVYFAYNTSVSYNPVMWTMPVELKGSFVALAFLAILGNVQRRDLGYAVLAFIFIWPQTYIFAFVLGVWLADLNHAADRRGLRDRLARLRLLPHVATALSLYLLLYVNSTSSPVYGWLCTALPDWLDKEILLHILGAGCLVWACGHFRPCRSFFSWQPLVSIGHYSFSLYLVHIPVMLSLGSNIFLYMRAGEIGYGTSALSAFLACLPVVALMTVALDKFFDKPSGSLARRFSRWALRS